MLWRTFGLPTVALALSHPHDFYFHQLAGFHPTSLEKLALSRNAIQAFDYYDKMIDMLKQQGYEFMYMSELYNYAHRMDDLQLIPLETWKKRSV